MNEAWYLDVAFPVLARIPTALPWRLAGWLGDLPPAQQRPRRLWLKQRFAQVFPHASAAEHAAWARAHLDMLAQEKVDGLAFPRLGRAGGPRIELEGAQAAQALAARGQGFILVLNHYDRLMTALVALAQLGIAVHAVTMPILSNAELGDAHRRYFERKQRSYLAATGGSWRATDQGLRPVIEGLRAGAVWTILADAWNPEFRHTREHRFFGGSLMLPTGIERIARATGAPLLQATTYTLSPSRLRVVLETLPEDPRAAVDVAIARLERDVRRHPWAWWHWGDWERMWIPGAQDEGARA